MKEIYPDVAHVMQLDVVPAAARALLDSIDTYIGRTSVPYVLAIHEDHLRTCLALLERAGRCAAGTAAKSSLATQHSLVAHAAGGHFDVDDLAHLHTLRMMRNCIVHSGGRVSAGLVKAIGSWTVTTEERWTSLAHRTPRNLTEGDRISLSHPELALATAVTASLDRAANRMLADALPRSMWADLVVEDLMSDRTVVPSAALRDAKAIARRHYDSLTLTRNELTEALERI